MKICQYCDTLNSDFAVICSGCGAGEFYHKCNNCGAAFEGLICPDCGVRADAEAAKCPSCGRRYFSYACPHCGYSPEKERQRTYDKEKAELRQAKEMYLRRAEEMERRREKEEEWQRVSEYDIKARHEAASNSISKSQPPEKKKSSFLLWLLGWVFIFPLPLTILCLRRKSGCFGQFLKINLIAIVWIFYLLHFAARYA